MKSKKLQKNHYIIKVFNLDPNILNEQTLLFQKLNQFSNKLKLTVVNKFFHKFRPIGITAVYVLAESHLAVHTWPETGYLHIDLFVCSSKIDFSNINKHIEEVFGTKNYKIKELKY